MVTQTILAASLLASSPSTSQDVGAAEGPICAAVPTAPQRIEVTHWRDTADDGTRILDAAATYRLSSGDIGEAFLSIDGEGSGEAQLMINGDIIAHVAIEMPTSREGPVLTTWMPPSVDYPPELIAELIMVDLPAVLAEQMPQEFKCSPFGKKVTKAASLLFRATAYAASVVCCLPPIGTTTCVVCVVGAGLAGDEIGDHIDEHCE